MDLPNLVVSDEEGNIFDVPGKLMVGMEGKHLFIPTIRDLIPLPNGSDLFKLPDRRPYYYDVFDKRYTELKTYKGMNISAVAAFMAPGYMQFFQSAYLPRENVSKLPLYAYSAIGWWHNKFYVTGIRVDNDTRQDLSGFISSEIEFAAKKIEKKYKQNRLVQHLVQNCVRRYACPAARNFVLQRYEFPVPVSPSCNAFCKGCLSEQKPDSGYPSPMDRILFVPKISEIVDYTVPHLAHSSRAVISFGQGCEGEPLIQGRLIEDSIRAIRKKTKKGVINLNTNGSLPKVIEKLCQAGLDSIRISLNSARKKFYNKYFRPQNYTFDDVVQSIEVATKHKIWISLNYFIFPGMTDMPDEINALQHLLDNYGINMLQTRNINIDPEVYNSILGLNKINEKPIGMRNWLEKIKKDYPNIKIGYFNPPKEEMKKWL